MSLWNVKFLQDMPLHVICRTESRLLGDCLLFQYVDIYIYGFPGGSVVKNAPAQCRRSRFVPWVRKISWRKKWQHTLFLPGKFHGQRSLVG